MFPVTTVYNYASVVFSTCSAFPKESVKQGAVSQWVAQSSTNPRISGLIPISPWPHVLVYFDKTPKHVAIQ